MTGNPLCLSYLEPLLYIIGLYYGALFYWSCATAILKIISICGFKFYTICMGLLCSNEFRSSADRLLVPVKQRLSSDMFKLNRQGLCSLNSDNSSVYYSRSPRDTLYDMSMTSIRFEYWGIRVSRTCKTLEKYMPISVRRLYSCTVGRISLMHLNDQLRSRLRSMWEVRLEIFRRVGMFEHNPEYLTCSASRTSFAQETTRS